MADGAVLDVMGSWQQPSDRGPAPVGTKLSAQEARRLLNAPLHEHIVQSIDSPKDVRHQVLRQHELLRAMHTINAYSTQD